MKQRKYFLSLTMFFFLMMFCQHLLNAQVQPIALHPVNPHYFVYKGNPTILITSGEHYGAQINLDFDYATYFEELQSNGLNLTRIFTGAYFEPAGAFNIDNNTLAPKPGRYIGPWLQTPKPGLANNEFLFDLTKWNAAYFNRLGEVVSAARARGIVVELTFFCPFYDDKQWELSPLNPTNNVNGVGNIKRTDVYTIDKNGGLLAIQDSLVRKLVTELKDFDNLIYEICNEPYFGGVTMEWQHHIADVISATEKSIRARHLVSQNIANGASTIKDPHPAVSVFNFHYAAPPYAVALNFHLDKVIGDNETGFAGNKDSVYRSEGWEFLMAGGGLYNNLDYSFTVGHEKGTFSYPSNQPGGGTTTLRKQLGYLKEFIYQFDFVRMRPDSTLNKNIPYTRSYGLAEPGKQYAIYFKTITGVNVELELPQGKYDIQWMNPVTGVKDKKIKINHAGGKAKVVTPNYTEDAALSVLRTD